MGTPVEQKANELELIHRRLRAPSSEIIRAVPMHHTNTVRSFITAGGKPASVVNSFVGKGEGAVNFSEKTFPLAFDVSDNEGSCIEGIKLTSLAEAGQTIHMFEASIADGRAIHLVDPSKHKLKDPGKAIKRETLLATRWQLGFKPVCSVFLKLPSMRPITSQSSNSALSVAHYVGVAEL
jgi:hypothetical protein